MYCSVSIKYYQACLHMVMCLLFFLLSSRTYSQNHPQLNPSNNCLNNHNLLFLLNTLNRFIHLFWSFCINEPTTTTQHRKRRQWRNNSMLLGLHLEIKFINLSKNLIAFVISFFSSRIFQKLWALAAKKLVWKIILVIIWFEASTSYLKVQTFLSFFTNLVT